MERTQRRGASAAGDPSCGPGVKGMKIVVAYSEEDLSTAFPEDCQGRNSNDHVDDVIAALQQRNHQVLPLAANADMFQKLLAWRGSVDLVFNLADQGFETETNLEPHIPALFDLLGLKYTGADYLCLGTCLDKARAKRLLRAHGLPTPDFLVFDSPVPEAPDLQSLEYPLIVKPGREDGSIGIKRDSVVEGPAELARKINEVVTKYRQPALVEAFIDGREINVGFLAGAQPEIFPFSEILFTLPANERNFLSYETKWLEDSHFFRGTTPQCPAEVAPELHGLLEGLTRRAYSALGVAGYGRVDFRINSAGKPFILEVNPNPDISRSAGFANMAKAHGLSYEDLIEKIVHIALDRA